MAQLSFVRRNSEAIVTGIVTACIVGGAVSLYEKYPALLIPFTYFLVCGSVAIMACVAVIGLRRIPKPLECPNGKNIDGYVRAWLDSYSFTVKNDPSDPTYFRYRVTLPPPDNEQLTIFRMRTENPEYIQVFADLSMNEEGFKQLQTRISVRDMHQVLFDLKMELARAKIGYSGLVIPPLNFKVFKRVLIYSGLKESEFFSAIHEVEAAIHMVTVIYLRMLEQKGSQENQSPTQPESASYIPTQELPPTSS
jgi:hypothetical protein